MKAALLRRTGFLENVEAKSFFPFQTMKLIAFLKYLCQKKTQLLFDMLNYLLLHPPYFFSAEPLCVSLL